MKQFMPKISYHILLIIFLSFSLLFLSLLVFNWMHARPEHPEISDLSSSIGAWTTFAAIVCINLCTLVNRLLERIEYLEEKLGVTSSDNDN